MRERLASLISGGGTTMQEIVLACQSGEIPMDVGCVISSDPNAGGLKRAKDLGIPEKDIVVVNPNDFRGEDGKVDRWRFGIALLNELRPRGITVVTQNGWKPLTPKNVLEERDIQYFNQHPGPKKETRATHGMQPHAIMLYIARHTGRNNGTEVITHRVNERFDDGPTVGITPVPIYLPYDHPKRLQRRALKKEHKLQIELLKQVARGEVKEVFSETVYLMPEEEKILLEARRYARQKYPDG